jgi:hypothetical protein
MKSMCPERQALTLKLSVASVKVYGLASEEAEATKKQDSNRGRFTAVLRAARTEARAAEKALGEHIKQHGCQ